jgi:transposase
MKVTTVGIDLAKNVFIMNGFAVDDKVMIIRTVGRGDLLAMFVLLPPCLVA